MAIPEFEPAPIPEHLLADNPYHQQGLRRRATPYYVDPNAQVVDNTSQFGRSVRSMAMNTRAGYTEALPGLARQLSGDEEGAQRNYAEFLRQSELASRLGPRVQSLDDVNGIGDAALWAMHLGVGTAPDIVTSMTGAGLGATAARGIARRGAEAAARRHVERSVAEQGMERAVNRQINDAMVRNTVGAADNRVLQAQFRDAIDDTAAGLVARSPGARRAMDQAARVGSIAGSGAGQYPGMVQDSVEALQQTDQAGAASIAATDTVASIIGGLPVDRLVGRIMGRGLREVPGADEAIAKNLREYLPKALKNVSKEALVQGGAEGVLGVAQAATQLAGHDYVLGQAEMFGPEAMNRYLAELVGGALVGGMMGGAVEAGRMAPEGVGATFGLDGDRRTQLTAAIRERLAAAADRARAFHERRNQARYAPGEEMGAGGPGPGTGEPGAPTGGVAGVFRDGMDAVQQAAAAAGRTLRSTYDRFRKNKEADAHEADLDDEASSSADLLARWEEGSDAPLSPEAHEEGLPQPRRPNVGPQAGLGTPLQRVLMTYMPEDSPIWQDPAAATSVAESLERMLRGEATDADRLGWDVALENGLPPQVFELWRMAGDQFAEALRTIPLDSDGGRVGAGAFSERMSGPERFVQQGGEEIDTDATAENIEAAQQQVDEDIDNPDARLDEGEAEGYGGYGVGGFDRGSLADQLLSMRQGVQLLDARIAEARERGQDVRELVAERRRASAEGVRLARRTREDLLGGPEDHPDFPGGNQPGTVFKENGKAPRAFEEKLAQPGQVQIDGFTLSSGKKLRKALDLGGLALRYRGRYMSGESLVDAMHTAFGELLVAGVRPDMSTLKAGDVKNNKGEVLFTLANNDVAALRNAARQYAMPEAGPIGRGDTTAAEAARVGRIQESVTADPVPVRSRRGDIVGEVGGRPRPDSTGFAPENDATFDERTSFDQIMTGVDMDPRTVQQGERELPPQGVSPLSNRSPEERELLTSALAKIRNGEPLTQAEDQVLAMQGSGRNTLAPLRATSPGSGERTSTTAPVGAVDFRDPYAKAVESAVKSDADAKRRDDEKVAEYERIENDPKVSPQEKQKLRIAYYEVQRKRARSDSMSEDGYTRAQELEGFRIGITELNRQRDDGTISQRAYAQQMRTLLGDGWKRHTGGLDLEAVNSTESFGDRNKAMDYFNRAKAGEFTSTPRVRELQQDDNALKQRRSTEEPAVLRVKNRVAEALTAARALDNSPEAKRYRELHARYQRGDRMSGDVFAEYRKLRAEYGPIEKGEFVSDNLLTETVERIKPIAENNRHPLAQKIRAFVRARRAQEASQGAERARAKAAADAAFAEMTPKQQARALEQLAYRTIIDNLDAIPADNAIHDAVQRPEESRVDAEENRNPSPLRTEEQFRKDAKRGKNPALPIGSGAELAVLKAQTAVVDTAPPRPGRALDTRNIQRGAPGEPEPAAPLELQPQRNEAPPARKKLTPEELLATNRNRLRELVAKHKRGEITAAEKQEIVRLRERIESLRSEPKESVARDDGPAAATPESIATGKPDLAREQAFANELLQKAGIDTPVEIRSYGDPRRKRKTSDRGDPNSRKIGRYSVNSRGEAVIYLSDSLTGAERLEVLAHELGHHMIRTELVRASNGKMTLGDIADMEMTTKDVMVALQAFNPELYAKLKKDYDAWVEANPSGLRTGAEVRASRAAYARANALLQRSKSNKPALARDDVDYLYDMEEWFADNIARALTSADSPAQGTVARFFKDIADKIKALYASMFGTPEAKKWAPAPSVDAFVRELFSRERAAVADVLGAEPSTAQVEAAVTTAVATNFILVHDPVVPPRRAENPPPGGTPPDTDKGMTPSGPGKNLTHVKGEAIRDLGPKSFQAAARFVRDFFTPDMRRIVEQALNRPAPMKRLREIYKDNPRILKALDSADRGMEAQIAAAYLAWKSGEFVVGPQARSAFIGADEGLSYIFNVAANGDMAQRIFNDMATGRIERIRQSGKDYDVRAIEARHRGKMQALANSANKIMDTISKPWSKFIDSKMRRAFASGIPAYRRIAAQLYRPQGTTGADRGMVREEAYELARWTTRARNALGDLSPLEQQRVLRALQEGKGYTAKIRDNFGPEVTQAEKARAAARSRAMQKASEDLRAMFDDMHAYMKERGVDLGRIENYFPVVMELTTDGEKQRLHKLLDQPKYHSRIMELFGDNVDLPEAIQNLVDGASQGTFDAPVGDGAPNFKAANYRLMSFIYELNDPKNAKSEAEVKQFAGDIKEFAALQSKDMARILERYVYGAVKRAEFAKRFGDDGAKLDTLLAQMEKQGATPEQVQDARDMVDAAIGRYGAKGSPVLSMLSPALAKRLTGPKSRSIIDGLQAYQNARVLPLALLSSLVDPLGIAVRTGGDLTTTWQGFRGGMRLLFRKSGRDDMIALMREVGMPDDADALQTLQMGYGGGDNPTARRVNEIVFKANGLAWLTQRTRGLALQTAHAFLLKHANSKSEASKTYLRELGVNASDIRRLHDHNGKQRVVVLSEAERATASPEALARDDRVRRALLQFTDEAVLRPHSQQTPQWHSDPYMRLVTQYKAFAYAMYDQIWGRVVLEWGKGNAAVLLPALAYLPVALMAELLREWIQWGEDGNPHRENWGALEYTQLAVERTGLVSPQMTFIESAYSDMQRGNLPGTSEIGPTGGQTRRLLDGRQWSQDFEDALPASSLWKRWINPTEWGQEKAA